MFSITILLLSLAAVIYRLWQVLTTTNVIGSKAAPKLKALERSHETGAALCRLVEADGAGSWPPKASHGDWPSELLPYHRIYMDMIPFLSSGSPSLDDDVNIERRDRFRSLMINKLNNRVDMARVHEILTTIEAGDWSGCSREAYNGFYCCISVLRHAYRWAAIPLVKVAQEEKIIDFPAQINIPWAYLQRKFGFESDSGNNTSNVLHNFNIKGERAYKINQDISETITSTEDAFFRIFYDVEVMVRSDFQRYELLR